MDEETLSLSYEWLDSETLQTTGVWNGDSLEVRLRRFDESMFLLQNRGFRWIQEQPFNR